MSGPEPQALGRPAPAELLDARLQLHHAAQLVAAVGKTLLEPQPDDSHPNLGWLAAEGALAGHRVPGPQPCQAALHLADLRLLLLDGEGKVADAFALSGATLADAEAWLAGALRQRFGCALPDGLSSPGYELPSHPVAEGSAFALGDGAAFAELSRWYAASDAALGELVARTPKASTVRCWPHHFDLATLAVLETGADGSATKTIGLGLSPGDDSYAEPYLYVTPWPYPVAAAELPAAPAGAHWHREGFTAAILQGSDLVAVGSAEAQERCLRAFLAEAHAACRRVHGG